MPEDSIVKAFDKKVMSFWLIIGIGAAKTVEGILELVAREWIDIVIVGLDVSAIALYFIMMLVGVTGLIAWKSLHRSADRAKKS